MERCKYKSLSGGTLAANLLKGQNDFQMMPPK